MSTRAAAAGHILGILALVVVVCPSWHVLGTAAAVELVDRNPFDPQRRPWKVAPKPQPEMPVLTPQDLQIEAIVSFGPMRGIVAQLDGKLRGSLPANAAGKVRIAVGQSFGAGYVLESVDANQAVVQGGNARYTIPVLRKGTRGSAPLPATLAVDQRMAPPPPVVSAPVNAPSMTGAAPAAAPQGGTFNAPFAPAVPSPPMTAQASSEAIPPAPQPVPTQQPMSLLEAIQAAQAAARNQQGAAPSIVNPFVAPKK